MFKRISNLKKKILSVAMAAAILLTGEIGYGGLADSENAAVSTIITASAAKKKYYCKYKKKGCTYSNTDQSNVKGHEKHCQYRPFNYCKYKSYGCTFKHKDKSMVTSHEKSCEYRTRACKYKYHNCTYTCHSQSDLEKHEKNCKYKKRCPHCGKNMATVSSCDKHIPKCTQNPNRECSSAALALLDAGLNPPKWDVTKQKWYCPYCYQEQNSNKSDVIVAGHIDVCNVRRYHDY